MQCRFHFFLSYLIHFHFSPNRARELEATCCSFSVQKLLEVCRPYYSTLPYFPPIVILDHRTSLHVPSILSSIWCHLEYHLFATIIVKLRDHVRNENIKERLKVESIAERCRKARLRWFGHVKRRDQDYVGRKTLEMVPPGRRKR